MRICGLPVSAVPALLWVCLCLVGGASGQLAGDRLATDYSVEEVSELDEIAFEQRALVEARRYCTYNAPARRTLCDRTSAGTAVLDVGSPDGRFALIFSDGYPRLLYGATRIVRWSSAIRLANTGCAYYATVYTAGGAMQLRCSTTVWLSLVVRNYGKVANRYVITNTGVVSFYNAGTLLMRIVPGVAKTSPSTAWIVSSRKTTTSRTRTKTRTRTRTKTKTTSTRSKTKTTSSRTLTRTSTSRTSTSRTATTKTTTYTTINPSLVPRFPIQNEVGAYFAAWSIYGRNYNLRNFSTTASASNLTYLNYAFGEVVPDGAGAYKCQLQDAWADYQTPFTATTSVDGVADTTGNLFGNFNQLKKLKVKFPNIRVLISLGGWTGSAYFSNASATQLLRSKLATSCIDLFLRGNLPVSGSLGGTGAAAGVFDGIDIDWEYPAVQGIGGNAVSPADTVNYNLLLAEFRRQLDELSVAKSRAYGLTVAIGAGQPQLAATQPAVYSTYLDWIQVMSYDFHGTWDSHTGFHCALYADYATTDLYSNANAAVTYLLTHGVSSRKVMLGIPFYGRGWTGVNRTNDGLYQKAAAAASGTYEAGIDDYKVIKLKNGTVFMNAPANATWKFDNTTGTFWTYDSPATIDLKVAYSKTKNLRGLFSWSIDGDTTDGELLGHMGGFL